MEELIRINTNPAGEQVVSARELYLALGYDKSNWTRWYK
jgi:phage anti-repressor protein